MSMKELSMDRICRQSYNERDLYTIRGKGMTLQQLTYLGDSCGVREHFGGCGDNLFISQPSLSAAIQAILEKEMGVTAFSRSSKGCCDNRREGEELLAVLHGCLLEQADIMQEHFGKDNKPRRRNFRCRASIIPLRSMRLWIW